MSTRMTQLDHVIAALAPIAGKRASGPRIADGRVSLILDVTGLGIDDPVAIHVTCSTRKMGLAPAIVRLAQRCSKNVLAPEEIGCCAFAGDKGFTHPEMNQWALRKLRAQLEKANVTLGFSNSRTCEIGLTTHGGVPYRSIVYLVDKVTTAKNQRETG